MGDKEHAVTIKEWAKIAIAKHSRKMLKYEAGVLKDKDPEDLHQMRVGMRRLRSAISGFAIALDLPATVSERNIAKIGRSLGKLRDLDVLLAALANDYRPQLPKSEQKNLDKVIKSLNKQRKKELKRVRETLNSKLYLDLTQGLQNWLDKSRFQMIGEFSIYPVLPDLLLPQVSQLLLHPGWLVGVELNQGAVHISESLDHQTVRQILEKQEPILHDLRKAAKKTRYNLELFSHFYGDTYNYYVKQIEQIQEVLGQIQDCYVLREVLEKVLQSAIAEQMPKLAAHFTKTRYQKWQEWQVLQEEFLEDKTRQELRQTIQQPIFATED
ncbi:MAG: CHAD domain-containing protein [Xenococcus sp. MO_188.B8]|nr:CHAD domain-containing protein [Xenococcus sp. MO_188.B8]